jgi:ABC-type amino acid transport system permease subunit
MRRSQVFFRGLVAGALGTLLGASAVLYTLSRLGWIHFVDTPNASPSEWLHWAYTNLGSSIPVFAALLLAYFITLGRLRDALRDDQPITRIVHFDHLTDIWTTLFFGAGVIWTAIGMRSALMFALGDRAAAMQQGAFAMLERMVDGGILLALSTTIFGGIGGYVMRVYKTVTLGTELQQQYDKAARADTSQMRASLQRIEEHLAGS